MPSRSAGSKSGVGTVPTERESRPLGFKAEDWPENAVYMGTFLGEPIFLPKLRCEGCGERVAEPADCPIGIPECPSFGSSPNAAYVQSICGGKS